MDKAKVVTTALGITVVLLAVAVVTARPWISDTPLYTVRMEQASSKMNFLPTAVNGFTYTTEKGYTLDCNVSGYCGAVPLISGGVSTCETCQGQSTCWNTCPDTCEPSCEGTCFGSTCSSTCPSTCSGQTCDTCTQPTCETCETCSTCPTQTSTCWSTCSGYTCKDTCEIDCW
ncbi:MAG: hypothetical protein HXS48_08240 [Theionarchaea archaeon]|nr:hypothetical protein [Theionarchaea archaeon]